MPKIYVESRGFVFTADQVEIDMLLAEGGRIVTKNKEIEQPIDDLVADPVPAVADPVPAVADPVPVVADPVPAVADPVPVVAEQWEKVTRPVIEKVVEKPAPKYHAPKFKSKLAR